MSSLLDSSFRDPSGFVFQRNSNIYRQINLAYQPHYEKLISSGLYDALVKKSLLIPHKEIDVSFEDPSIGYKVIQPEKIPFISYPYEWCFSQLKLAALVTLEIQTCAMKYGMSLKDASAYNIQFIQGRPIFIDTLSFEPYQEGKPWVAYRQFCQHFIGPLALMKYGHIQLGTLSNLHIDGPPLDLVSSILPLKSYLNFSILVHLHLHATFSKNGLGSDIKGNKKKVTEQAVLGLISSLESGIKKMELPDKKSVWAQYYSNTNYSENAFQHKKQLIEKFLDESSPKSVWDLGGNTGLFSRIANNKGIDTVSLDFDPLAVEYNYQEALKNKDHNILPLVMDITNPSSGIGWNNTERESLKKRGPADTILALGLVHHLAIGNNIPFEKIANYFSKLCNYAIVEFISKEDSQVQRLLSTRTDIFSNYNKINFEEALLKHFEIISCEKIKESDRYLYHLKNSSLS